MSKFPCLSHPFIQQKAPYIPELGKLEALALFSELASLFLPSNFVQYILVLYFSAPFHDLFYANSSLSIIN